MRKIISILLILLSSSLFAQLTPEQLFESASKNCYVVVNKAGNSIGTGFLLTNGYIITNHHVVDGASPTEITLKPINNTNEIIACEKLFVSSKRDIAIIKPLSKIENEGLELDTVFPKIGSGVYVIGNSEGLTGTFSNGLVSQVREEEGLDAWIQISAPISHGNSGGPVMNANGKVIGMSTWGLVKGQNLNFALPTKYISAFLRTNGIGSDVVNSEEESASKVEKSKAQAELDEVRALFTPEQLELVKSVDNLYLQRNLLTFIPLTLILIATGLLLWKYKKSGSNSLIQFMKLFPKDNDNKATLYALTYLICGGFLYKALTDYPSFFKTDIENIEAAKGYRLYGFEPNPEDYQYSQLLNATYYGSDTALFFLADAVWQGDIIVKADTMEALKWFNALANKGYYAGQMFDALCALNGWNSRDAQTFIKSSNKYTCGYINALASLHKKTKDPYEKANARGAITNIVGLSTLEPSAIENISNRTYGFDTIKSRFVGHESKKYFLVDSIIAAYNWFNIYMDTYNTIHKLEFGTIPSHAKYLNDFNTGYKNHSELINNGKAIIPPWVMAKDFFIKAKNGKEIKYSSYRGTFNYSVERWSKKDSDIDYYLKTIEEINRVWQEDTTIKRPPDFSNYSNEELLRLLKNG
jgi:hypothetical protein